MGKLVKLPRFAPTYVAYILAGRDKVAVATSRLAMELCRFLSERRIPFERIVHPPAFTAQKRAHFLHVPGRLVAKSVLLGGAGHYLLAILPATHHVDLRALGNRLGLSMQLASLDQVHELFRDCEWGVVPAFGTPYGVKTVLDDSLHAGDTLVCEGQTLSESIRLSRSDFEALERPMTASFAGNGASR